MVRESNNTFRSDERSSSSSTHHTPIQYTQIAVWQREEESSHYRRSSQTAGRCTVHPVCVCVWVGVRHKTLVSSCVLVFQSEKNG